MSTVLNVNQYHPHGFFGTNNLLFKPVNIFHAFRLFDVAAVIGRRVYLKLITSKVKS